MSTGSAVYNTIDRRIGLIAFIILDALATLAVAVNQIFWVYLLAMALLGIAAGAIDVGNTVTILYIWKERSNPFMQGLHFAFSVAMVLSPYLVTPFLTDAPHNSNHTGGMNDSIVHLNIHSNQLGTHDNFVIEFDQFNATLNSLQYNSTLNSHVMQATDWIDDDEQLYNSTIQLASELISQAGNSLHLIVPFAVCTGVLLVAAVGQFVLFFLVTGTSVVQSKDEEVVIAECKATKVDKKQSLTLIGAGCLLLCFYNVSEMNSFIYAPNFITFRGYSEASGADLARYMSTAYSICRLASIIIATRVPTLYMLYIHFVIIAVGNVTLLLADPSSLIQLTVGLCIVGSGLSAVFAALYAFYEELMDVTNGICGAFMFASALAVSLTPIVEGQFLPTYPAVYNYINLAALFICCIILLYIHLFHRNKRTATR